MKRRRRSSPVQASTSEESSTARSSWRRAPLSTGWEESVRINDRYQQLAYIDEKRFEEMRSYNQLLLDIEQQKIRIMREKHDMDKKKEETQEDERILGIDLDACKPAQRLYYEALQEEILEKIAARRMKRQGT